MMFHDDPAFVEEMMDGVADFLIAMMGQILDQPMSTCTASGKTWRSRPVLSWDRGSSANTPCLATAASSSTCARAACPTCPWTAMVSNPPLAHLDGCRD